MKTLYDECMEALGEYCEELPMPKARLEYSRLDEVVPFTEWGRIDWEKVERKYDIEYLEEILDHLHEAGIEDLAVTLLWSTASIGELPAIRTQLTNALRVIDDVTCVGHDTYMLSSTGQFVIEFFHDGIVRMAILD
jgi:hypothetical protein